VKAAIHPKERTAMIQSQIEWEILRQMDGDHHWEDQINVSFPLFWWYDVTADYLP